MKGRLGQIPARDAGALAGAVIFLVLGFMAIDLMTHVAKVRDGAVLAGLLLLPALLYLLLSGRVSDLKGPGGLEVTLSQAANQSIPVHSSADGGGALSYEQVHEVEKGRTASFIARVRDLTPDDPVVLTLTLGAGPIDGTVAADYAFAFAGGGKKPCSASYTFTRQLSRSTKR